MTATWTNMILSTFLSKAIFSPNTMKPNFVTVISDVNLFLVS